MSDKSKIQWTDRTWNPTRGCSRTSEGCRNCYAERQAARFSDPGQYAHGFVERTPSGPRWTGRVELVEGKLTEPLRWRKPQRVFVNSMSDLFHEALPDEAIDRVFAVMALAPHLTFQVLTKRADRMREYFAQNGWKPHAGGPLRDRIEVATMKMRAGRRTGIWRDTPEVHTSSPDGWPIANVWLGVSVEDCKRGLPRIDDLRQTPAAVRFLSVEPLIEDVAPKLDLASIDWVIVGGESGPGARPCDVEWIRSVVEACDYAGVASFVKQLGAFVEDRNDAGFDGEQPWHWPPGTLTGRSERFQGATVRVRLRDAKGGDPAEWPEDLRVREFPAKDVAIDTAGGA